MLWNSMIDHLQTVGFNEETRVYNEATIKNIISYGLHYVKNGSILEFYMSEDGDEKTRGFSDIRFYDKGQNVKLIIEVKKNKSLEKAYTQCEKYMESEPCKKIILLGINVNITEKIELSMSASVYYDNTKSQLFIVSHLGCALKIITIYFLLNLY